MAAKRRAPATSAEFCAPSLHQMSVTAEAAARATGAKTRAMSVEPDQLLRHSQDGHRSDVTAAEAAGCGILLVQFTSNWIPSSSNCAASCAACAPPTNKLLPQKLSCVAQVARSVGAGVRHVWCRGGGKDIRGVAPGLRHEGHRRRSAVRLAGGGKPPAAGRAPAARRLCAVRAPRRHDGGKAPRHPRL